MQNKATGRRSSSVKSTGDCQLPQTMAKFEKFETVSKHTHIV